MVYLTNSDIYQLGPFACIIFTWTTELDITDFLSFYRT